jgi:hypothetical protein
MKCSVPRVIGRSSCSRAVWLFRVPRQDATRICGLFFCLLLAVVFAAGCAGTKKSPPPGLLEPAETVEILPAIFLITEDGESATAADQTMSRLIEQEIAAAAETLIVLSGIRLSHAGLAASGTNSLHLDFPGNTALADTSIELAGIPPEGWREQAGIHAHPPAFPTRQEPLSGKYLLAIKGSGVYTTFTGRMQSSCGKWLGDFACNSLLAAIVGWEHVDPEVEVEDELASSVSLSAALTDVGTREVVWSDSVVDESYEGDRRSSDFRNPIVVYVTCQRLLGPLLGESKMKAESYRPRFLKD